jgi:ribonucleoside-diphosphate reductase alpha chain
LFLDSFDSPFAAEIYSQRYQHPTDGNWTGTTKRVIGLPMGALYAAPNAQPHVGVIQDTTDRLMDHMGRKFFIPGGRYLYSTGRDYHQVNNCLLLRVDDSREGLADASWRSEMALQSGAGIGVWYGDIRPAGSPVSRTGGVAGGPVAKMIQINETGRSVISGGDRRSAIWAGLPWWHADIFEFIKVKDWSDEIRALKEKDWQFPAPMDMTNISVQLDDAFFYSYDNSPDPGCMTPRLQQWFSEHGTSAPDGSTWDVWAERVYSTAVEHMVKHGEPGFSIDTGDKSDEVLRNACTEITSAHDSDVCNLGSLVLPRFSSPQEFEQGVRDAVAFLTAGSMYSHVPYDRVAEVRELNRRLGLGLIGVHEFLLKRGVSYGTDNAFEVMDPYMKVYARALEFAIDFQDILGLSNSIAATAIAPNGTIGIIAESTPSGDPLFSAAELRNVKVASAHGDSYVQHVVVDPTAARLVREGIKPGQIEDAYSLSLMPGRRLAQQAYMQQYVDHAISSTLNIHAPITDKREAQDFGKILMGHLPNLRGTTVYPDGARAGQPRTSVDLAWALENEGTVIEGNEATCVGGVCGV